MLKRDDNKKGWRPATELVHGGTMRSNFGEVSEAMFLTQGYVYKSAEQAEARFKGEEPGFIYSRYSNPTTRMFEERMMLLEGAEDARSTASGMAAVSTALQCQLQAGDHVVSARALFGSCRYVVETVLGRMGVTSTFVDGRNLDEWQAAVQPNTKVFFMETPTNPTLELVDIAAVAEIAHQAGARLVVDNVFATPLFQHPLELGADVVVYSATKHIDGQGRCLGGVVLSSKDWIDENLHDYYRHTGPAMSPFNAWTLLKGLETLSLRVKQATASAAKIADYLADHPKVARVFYPGRDDHPDAAVAKKQMSGGSTLIAFEMKGGKKEAFAFANGLELILLTNNLGDAKTLTTHPATTTHKNLSQEARDQLGISDGLMRLSVGIEDTDDILEDIEGALAGV
ncbi:O-succinylhomoserine sulfhydrylase [Fulvimarina sp. MAC8]|uniref:O-succinylhomoserine sulfhydrylase n=1 Tax=Fulvimarina sp. MAC8 TaxID=3162874 RepID=UPI0032F0972E